MKFALSLALGSLLCACGGSTPRTGAAFTENDHLLFDDSVDLISDPTALEGQWRTDWSGTLDGRVRDADVVAYVTVRTVRTDVDLEHRATMRVVPEVERELLGDFEVEDLLVSESEPGFSAVRTNERSLLGRRFVVFLRWEATGTTIAARWHLSPAEREVTDRVEYLLERRGVSTGRGRVFVHEN